MYRQKGKRRKRRTRGKWRKLKCERGKGKKVRSKKVKDGKNEKIEQRHKSEREKKG